MKLASLLVQKSLTERHSVWLNPSYILAVLPDRTAPQDRTIIALSQPLADYGAQLVIADNVMRTRNVVNDALADGART